MSLPSSARKKSGKTLLVLSITAVCIIGLQSGFAPELPGKKIEKYYLAQLKIFENQLLDFDKQLQAKTNVSNLRQRFLALRLSYKKIAVLTEYYSLYESKLVNMPALQYANDDNTQTMKPHGLQVIEQTIYGEIQQGTYRKLREEIAGILKVCRGWKNAPGLDRKFAAPSVFQALQYAMIRLMTMGISGFDSPVAQYSLPEATATIESIESLLRIYNSAVGPAVKADLEKLEALLGKSVLYVNTHNNFYRFDRMTFIKNYMSPAYMQLVDIRKKAGYFLPAERNPVNMASPGIFDSSFFNIDYFSPAERFRMTPERIALGVKLFNDPILSGTGKRSCTTCHKPELAFTDGLKTALAMDEQKSLLRNTPTLWNAALQTKQFYDSRVVRLEFQLSDVLHNAEEMKGSLERSVQDLRKDSVYIAMFARAYPNEVDEISPYNIANAISTYIRTLVSVCSKFDRYIRNEITTLAPAEKRGFNLFMGKAKCGTCHFMPLFNGLAPPGFTETESEVIGVPATDDQLHPVLDADKGKYNFTKAPVHLNAFKTPTLRNIARTAPYMHNGVFNTLEEVLQFYNNAGGAGLHIAPHNASLSSNKLNLSKKEIADIIAFMKTLTSTTAVCKQEQ